MGLGPRTTNAFYTSIWQPQNHGYWYVQSVKQTHVYRNIGVLKLICENERTIFDTLLDKSMCTDLKCHVRRDNFLHSWHLTTTLIKMGLCFVSSGMKLNSKSPLVVSFIILIFSVRTWTLVRRCIENLLYIFCERYMTGRLNRSCEELLCLSNAKFRALSSWNDACHREISFRTESLKKYRSLFQGNFAQKALNCHSNFRANFPGKCAWTKNEIRAFRLRYFCTILYYFLYDKSHCKTHSTIIPFSILLQILASPAKK